MCAPVCISQTFSFPSSLPVTTHEPSRESAAALMASACPRSVWSRPPVEASQITTVLSSEHETIRLPPAATSTTCTQSSCPTSTDCSPVATFQTLTVLSAPPETTQVPSGENAQLRTGPLWPVSVSSGSAVSTFQSRS